MENKRTCGGCTACCLTHAILEIRKPAGKDCPFCKPNVGCNIYDNRPNGCLNFRCNWLRGDGDDLCRPDRTGVVFDSCTGGLLKKFLQIWEARPGAISTPEIWEATRIALDSQVYAIHLYLSGQKILFVPKGMALTKKARIRIQSSGLEITSFPILGIPASGG